MGLLGFLAGCIFTRRVMAPAFCPNCINRNQWIKELSKRNPEEKAESRRFYWLRRKKKDTETLK